MSRTLTRTLPDAVRAARLPRPQFPSCRAASTQAPRKPDALSSVLASGAPASSRPASYTDFDKILESPMPPVDSPQGYDSLFVDQAHRLHIYATKHNTHITLTRPPSSPTPTGKGRSGGADSSVDAHKPPEPNQPVFTFATGMIGFRKSGRGDYDAAFQLAGYVLRQVQERGLLPQINKLEVVLRGFGAGREAVVKALLGQEGRFVRRKISAVTDATRLKFGGSRSPNPRRLG